MISLNLRDQIPILRAENQMDTDSWNIRGSGMDEEKLNGRMKLERIRKNKEDVFKGEFSQAQMNENNKVWADFIGERKKKVVDCKWV